MIKLPAFTFIGDASTPAEIADKLAQAAAPDQQIELRQSREAMLYDDQTRQWYDLAIREQIAALVPDQASSA